MSGMKANPNIQTSQDQLWYRFHNVWPVQVPLSVPVPGMPLSEVGEEAKEPKTQMTTLPNGVRVISEDSPSIGAAMAIYFATGSRMETQRTTGSSHFLQHLAFKATKDKSHFRMTREIERLGAHAVAGASRDCIAFAGECLSSKADGLFDLMAETALNPRTEDLDMDNARALVISDSSNAAKNGPNTVLDAMHAVAFGGSGLGGPLLCPPPVAQMISGQTIDQFIQETLAPSRIVVSAVGVEHAKLVDLAGNAFGSMSASSPAAPAPAKYQGGEFYIPGPQDMGEVNFHVALECKQHHMRCFCFDSLCEEKKKECYHF
jgi:processing peptidase subunit alpha